MRTHILRVYDNDAWALIIYKVNKYFSFFTYYLFSIKKQDISNQTNSFALMENLESIH